MGLQNAQLQELSLSFVADVNGWTTVFGVSGVATRCWVQNLVFQKWFWSAIE